ncbi:hypothetical protein [Prevotella histicola]|uniref:hypothetical protein n=1 Tax=Prevotella histicola TaxID=470565 RepID=UPI0028EAE9BA|nr:hypothetical protein [Prevotella histicola]
MNLNNISLPYPVLGISDDIQPSLAPDNVSAVVEKSLHTYTFKIALKFDNEDISKIIDDGDAEFSCEYDCPRTMLRECVKSKYPYFTIDIPKYAVNGRLNFSCYVSVKHDIPHYVNSGFNADYEGFSFHMEPGDILVAFESLHYDADIKYDKLQAAGSFMQIRESNLHKEVFFDISGNKIDILMPPQLYQLYGQPTVKGAAEIIHSSIVLNALTYALMMLVRLDDRENDSRLWVRTILYRLKDEAEYSLNDLDEESTIPGLTQRLLKDPYLRLFNHINISNLSSFSEEL